MAGTEQLFKYVRVETMKSWGRLKPCGELTEEDFVLEGEALAFQRAKVGERTELIMSSNYKCANAIHFISHRWDDPRHPDPTGKKFQLILQSFPADCLIWMDYLCLPQEPRGAYEEYVFRQGIRAIPNLIEYSWFCAIEADKQSYQNRTWCQFEAMCAIRHMSLPKIPVGSVPRTEHDAIESVVSYCRLMDIYLECRDALPRIRLSTEERDEGQFQRAGYYLDVPSLNDPSFSKFKEFFFGLEAADPLDVPILWNSLGSVFPPRRADFTFLAT